MKILIAIMSCHAYAERAQACRDTWVPDIVGADVMFFLGRPHDLSPYQESTKAGEVWLDVPDDYRNFPLKVQAMRRWAYDRGYDLVYKADDDSYVRPERLLADIPTADYKGRIRGPSGKKPAPYCSGFGYWMSRKAIGLIKDTPWDEDIAEDRWTANELLKVGIRPEHDFRFAVVWSKANALSGREAPRVGNPIIASCEYGPNEMKKVDQEFHTGVASVVRHPKIGAGTMNRVSVMIKTFCRDGYLKAALTGLDRYFYDAPLLIVDDGHEEFTKITLYADLRHAGHSVTWLPFDSGFGAKANEAIRNLKTEYVLIGSDDFEFTKKARTGVEKMLQLMDAMPELGVVSGRVDGRPYESCLVREGNTIREIPGHYGEGTAAGVFYQLCDLTVNYSLIRREVFNSVSWDEDVKIGGGEHGAFFLDVQEAGWLTAVVPDALIYQLRPNFQWQTKDYPSLRARARAPGRPCLKRRGIDSWICQDGRVELT